MNENIFDVDLEDFEQSVIEASYQQPMLVDFWADWCSPCIVLAPQIIQAVNDQDGKVRLAKLEVDEGDNMKLAGRFQVRGFPTVILFRNGEEIARFASARSASWIEQWLEEELGNALTD